MTVCDLRPGAVVRRADRPPPNALVAIDAKSRPVIWKVIDTLLSYD